MHGPDRVNLKMKRKEKDSVIQSGQQFIDQTKLKIQFDMISDNYFLTLRMCFKSTAPCASCH